MAFDGPVCLTRSGPCDAYSGQLIFYDVVDASVYSRSSALSFIVEAGGEAVLPDMITLKEFKTWLTASKTERKELEKAPFTSICALLKVADVLGDERVEEWIRLAARSLPLEPNWLASTCSPEEASEGIDKLSDLLQRRLFVAAAVDSTRLFSLLDFLPRKHHAAVLDATISDTKSLKAPLRESLHVAKALSSMRASPPSFLSLDVYDVDSAKPIPAASPPGQHVPPFLEQALFHDSSLTSLRLKLPCITSSSLELISSSIASLKRLQSLFLITSTGPDSLPTLQQTLAALPTLQHLSISFASSETLKRQRDEGAAGFRQHCMSAMLSAATALTSLDLLTVCESEFLTATAPLSMPQLRHLAMKFACNHTSAAAALLSHLSAPLTSLNMHHDKSPPLPPSAVPDTQCLFANLAHFTELRSLALSTPQDEKKTERAIHDAVSAAAPAVLASLPHLVSLSISSELPVLQLIIPLLANRQAGLTELVLGCRNRPSATWGAWPEVLQQLALLRLQRLKVSVSKPASVRLAGLAALPPLPHLTALSISAWACLSSPVDFVALASMTHMRALHLIGMRVTQPLQWECVRCLAALSALTSLQFLSARQEGSISGMLDSHVPHGAMPLLQELGLDIWWPSHAPPEPKRHRGRWEARMGLNSSAHGDSDDDPEASDGAPEMPCPYEGGPYEAEATDEVQDAVRTVGRLAMRLPAVTRLDLALEQNGNARAGLHELGGVLEDIASESALRIEVTHEGQLPF